MVTPTRYGPQVHPLKPQYALLPKRMCAVTPTARHRALPSPSLAKTPQPMRPPQPNPALNAEDVRGLSEALMGDSEGEQRLSCIWTMCVLRGGSGDEGTHL